MEIVINNDNLFKIKEFYFCIYLLFINLYGYTLIIIDKYKARKNKWRISEKTFFIIAILGGAMGMLLGMTMVRHKTQHKSFYLGIPIVYLIYKIFFVFLVYKLYF